MIKKKVVSEITTKSTKSSKELILLVILAASISTDDLNKIDSALKKLKIAKVNALKIYETILHCYLFCGFPAVIESLKLFKKEFENFKLNSSPYNVQKFKKYGKINCKLVYKNNYKKLIDNMQYLSPDIKEWMIIEGYGKVMNRPGLSMLEREFVTVSILSTRFYKDQLHSHIKGCLNLNASYVNVKYILSKIKHITGSENYEKTLKLLNHILRAGKFS